MPARRFDRGNMRHYRLCAPSRGTRRQRPSRRAAEQHDELAPYHSITSSASASNDGGTSVSVRHTTVSMTNPTDRIEIITSVRRRWTASEKVRMVEEKGKVV
jgi:hypothetical protein